MTRHTCPWCTRWTSHCNGRGRCSLGNQCPVVSIDPCAPRLEADGWTDETDGEDRPAFRSRASCGG